MTPARIATGMLALLLEIGLLVAFVRLGLMLEGPGRWLAALALVALAILPWWLFAAPKAPRRLRGAALVAFKLTMFLGGAVALAVSGVAQPLAVAFFLAAVIQVALAVKLDAL